ncbi:hypothetical protein GSF70_03420 [Flavobacteriaceae bacterium W22]|nr:hypothetical protein [Flavobacteriaceae bacterium W22]
MKTFYTTVTGTYFRLYSDLIEERTNHFLFWGLLSFTTKRVYRNETA